LGTKVIIHRRRDVLATIEGTYFAFELTSIRAVVVEIYEIRNNFRR